jgi:hypothetical protein
MFYSIVRAGAVGAGAASRYGSGSGSGSDQKMRLLAAPAPAPQQCLFANIRLDFRVYKLNPLPNWGSSKV